MRRNENKKKITLKQTKYNALKLIESMVAASCESCGGKTVKCQQIKMANKELKKENKKTTK